MGQNFQIGSYIQNKFSIITILIHFFRFLQMTTKKHPKITNTNIHFINSIPELAFVNGKPGHQYIKRNKSFANMYTYCNHSNNQSNYSFQYVIKHFFCKLVLSIKICVTSIKKKISIVLTRCITFVLFYTRINYCKRKTCSSIY